MAPCDVVRFCPLHLLLLKSPASRQPDMNLRRGEKSSCPGGPMDRSSRSTVVSLELFHRAAGNILWENNMALRREVTLVHHLQHEP